MEQWYYSQFGQTKGPVSTSIIVSKVLKQELEVDSYVMTGKDELWKKIKDIPVIMDELHKPEAIPHKVEFPTDFLDTNKEVRVGNLYYYIPLSRMLLLNLFTFGLFQLYWFYKQWYYWACKHKQGHRSPDREMSWILFPWTIFKKIETDKELNAVARSDFNGTLLFWVWSFSGLFFAMLVHISNSHNTLNQFVYYLGGIVDVVFLIPIQRYINRVNDKLGNKYEKPGCGLILVIVAALALVVYAVSLKQIVSLFQV